MAFSLDGIIIDRIQLGVAEDFSGNLLYTLTQLSDATIDVSAEAKEAKDKDGTLIKKFWQSKSASFKATNAMVDFNILGEQSGSGKQIATSSKKVVMPKVTIVEAGTSKIELSGLVTGTVRVNAIEPNGTMGKKYAQAASASATEFGLASNTLTLPTDGSASRFVVKYERQVESGVKIANNSDEFPRTIKLTLKALAVDPCSADTVRACYIVLPSFQVSPECSLSLTTDAQFEFNGDCQVDYCAIDKNLYYICMAEEDEE